MAEQNAQLEGDDILDERPLRVILFGSQFAALDDAAAMGFSASGPHCVRTMALRLSEPKHRPNHCRQGRTTGILGGAHQVHAGAAGRRCLVTTLQPGLSVSRS